MQLGRRWTHWVGSARGVAVLLAGCVAFGASAPAAADTASPLTDGLLERGPFGTGVATLTLVDPTRPTPPNGTFPGAATRTLVTEVWYPTGDATLVEERGAPIASTVAGFPLIVYAHGLGSSRTQIRFAARHLSTHGYVVAAMDFPLSNAQAPGGPTGNDVTGQVGDLFFTTGFIQGVSPFAGSIDPERTGLAAHSLGGATVLAATSAPIFDSTFDALALLAPAACALTVAGVPFDVRKPVMTLSGTVDIITPFDLNAPPVFEGSEDPRYLISVDAGTHGGFLDNGPTLEALFPGVPIDAVICQAIASNDPIALACGLCNPAPLTATPIAAQRQLDLTRAGLLAFFDGYLGCEPLGLAYLEHMYDRENDELDVIFSGHSGKGRAHCAAR